MLLTHFHDPGLTLYRYTDHTYVVLTLQKLVHLHPDNDSDSDSDNEEQDITLEGPRRRKRGSFWRILHNFMKRKRNDDVAQNEKFADGVHDPTNEYITAHTDGVQSSPVQKLRTLQRYHGGPNQERATHMEKISPLTQKKLAVSAEQVSIFLTAGKLPFELVEFIANLVQIILSFHFSKTPPMISRLRFFTD